MPDQPNSPNLPVFSGMNGSRLAGAISGRPKPMTARMIATFRMTIRPLTDADSRMPTDSSAVRNSTIPMAGRLISEPVAIMCPSLSVPMGAVVR